ncbi:uncharacterized protein K444DRAFT_629069 [Hyaloscypha bicolor E]|uniref:Protein kinase domain-containing protein n=1 Tax=Hyaloscypha bicolor E TaxID=1095630 RepID=A0A2J6TDE9_9HELO|nr:uncharacterized protein K444DRAFT_629069 [Hyaloscypha bicolor E]PMD61065.1 hypothetical protein K444DRAFT_629069 [Hyaloscypha bicolor E]
MEVPGSTENNRGRHGNLKPENILWFKGPGCDGLGGPTGVLQICDFGLADFHSTQWALVPAGNIGGLTHAYRTPEWDVSNLISPSYDIWSLGCVLLEFVTWYMLGAKKVKNFEDKRVAGSPEIALSTTEDPSSVYTISPVGVGREWQRRRQL